MTSKIKDDIRISQSANDKALESWMKIDESFAENTEIIKRKDSVEIRCKKGLWSVYSHDPDESKRMALHYFLQYYADGEYGPAV